MTTPYNLWSDSEKVPRIKQHEYADYYDPCVPMWGVVFLSKK